MAGHAARRRAVKSVLCVLLLTAASAADACRCSQQDLAAYFAAAEEVVMARLTGWEAVAGDVPERLLRLELLVPPYKVSGSPGGNAGDPRHYRTAGTSATCGLVPEVGAIYLLFAQRSGRGDAYVPLQVDSCSGSRVFLPAEGGEAAGFTDVPARFVVQQLNGLAGLELLREVAARHPDPDASENDTLVGLLDVAGFSHAGAVRVFERPIREGDKPRVIGEYAALETRELAYESPAAVVYARDAGWYRLRLSSGEFAWLPAEYAGSYFAYDELPVRRLAYIRRPWHGFIWPEPGAGLPIRAGAAGTRREQPVEVRESRKIADSLWFRIEMLENNPCDGGASQSAFAGWVPAYRETGEPLIWYYSRGC